MYISGCRVQNAAMSAVSIPEGDDYFNLVTLLLPGTGTNGAQNNTFLDSSSSSVTVTRNGTPTQGTFSPFSQTGWSGYFDGTGDYLITTGGVTNAGTGDVCVEAWVYYSGTFSDYSFIFDSRSGSSPFTDGFNISVNITNGYFYLGQDVQNLMTSIVCTKNTWFHVCATRQSGVFRLFVNGVLGGTYTSSSNLSGTTNRVGASYGNVYFWNGNISNLRSVKGSVPAQYQTSSTTVGATIFLPPTAPLTAIANTSLLTCQSNRFIDNSTNAFAISALGDASVQAFAPFNPTQTYSNTVIGGSEYMVRTDYLTVPANAALKTFTGDFTIESWVYPLTTSGAVGGGGAGFIDTRTNGGTAAPWVFGYGGYVAGSGFTLDFFDGSSRVSSLRMPVNQWSHVAMTRQGSTLRFFINGVVDPTTYSVGGTINGGTNPLFITNSKDYAINSAWGSQGYWADFRIVNGTAVYTSSFTPPTAPLTAITNTTLLLNFTNGGILDATSKNNLQTVGGAAISTAQSKFGGSSMAFDGSGDYLQAPNTANANFGSGNFTIEFWMYASSQALAPIVHQTSYASNLGWIVWNYDGVSVGASTRKLTFMLNGASFVLTTSSDAYANNTWTHIAVVKNGTGSNNIKIYSNGSEIAAGTYSTALSNATQPLMVGGIINGVSWNSTNYYNGYLDDLRITKGLARYTANFTPPTTAFPLF